MDNLVSTRSDLESLCGALSNADWIAFDTEFMREKTYYPKLCLLQVATDDVLACIDPLALDNLDCLMEVLYKPSNTLVMHACGQDLEILYHLNGELPAKVFDTQVAAPLLGHRVQASYASLVTDMLGVNLGKAHTRTDWSKRPLSSGQIDYAQDDVKYLAKVYQLMTSELKKRNRLDWLKSDFEALLDPARYFTLPQQAWKRVKTARRLRGSQLSILQELASWREHMAQEKDIPRAWLFKDDVLTDISRLRPDNIEQLKKIRGLSDRSVSKHGGDIIKLIQRAAKNKPEAHTDNEIRKKLSAEQEAIVDMLNAIVHMRASELEMDSTVLASRKLLQALVTGGDPNLLFDGWRAELIGGELQDFMDGKKNITIENGSLIIADQ